MSRGTKKSWMVTARKYWRGTNSTQPPLEAASSEAMTSARSHCRLRSRATHACCWEPQPLIVSLAGGFPAISPVSHASEKQLCERARLACTALQCHCTALPGWQLREQVRATDTVAECKADCWLGSDRQFYGPWSSTLPAVRSSVVCWFEGSSTS